MKYGHKHLLTENFPMDCLPWRNSDFGRNSMEQTLSEHRQKPQAGNKLIHPFLRLQRLDSILRWNSIQLSLFLSAKLPCMALSFDICSYEINFTSSICFKKCRQEEKTISSLNDLFKTVCVSSKEHMIQLYWLHWICWI